MTAKTQKLIAGPIVGYKGTDEDMKCHGFQFQMGINILPGDEPLELCRHGFHFCQQPSGPFAYKDYARVFKVEAYDILDADWEPGADYKQVCRRVRFLEEIVIGGDGNTGYRNTGHRNTGERNTGNRNTGNRNTGERNTGNRNTGYSNTGYGNTGDFNTGYRNTGNRNTGNRNTGDFNTGYSNTGYGNTGDFNTGYSNTGNRNTGSGNVADDQTGFFCLNSPTLHFFDLPTELTRNDLDFILIRRLGRALAQNEPFDCAPFLQLPNATEDRIKALHKAHVAARKKHGQSLTSE
jgi:hypothetical protein